MDRREALNCICALSAGACCGAVAQAEKIWRIAYLSSVSAEADKERFEEFRRSMRNLGYVEGHNLAVDARWELDDADRLAELARQLARLQPDVIVTVAAPATVAVKKATTRIPIVFSGVGDPVAFGLVTSLSLPGGNVTGVANIVSDLAGKRLELLKETVPGLTSVGVLFEPHTPVSVLQWEASEKAANRLALRVHPMRIDGASAYEAAFAEAASTGIAAVAASLSPTASSNAARIARLAVTHRLPSIYARSLFVEAGGLMSYGPSFATDGRASARLVQRILSGARPADLPVEQPNEFELIINTATARQLGLIISSSLLLRASRVIGS
jgi:putative ABC transport system substrate-binding protein